MGSFTKFKEVLSKKNAFLVIGHIKPDGDSIGSMLALGEVLSSMGKDVDLVCRDLVPEVFSFLEGSDSIQTDFLIGKYEAVVLIDNGDLKRTGFYDRLIKVDQYSKPIINIDHHTRNDIWKLAKINYADPEESSSAAILYKVFKGLDIAISPKVATYLLLGLYTDTGGFVHTNTTDKVLKITAEILNKGANLKIISKNLNFSKGLTTLKLWGIALERLSYDPKNKFVYSVLTKEDIKEADASEDEVSGLINLMNSAEEANFSLLLYEIESDKIKGSLRTEKDDIDVSRLAKALGGGGHKKAAGFEMNGRLTRKKGNWRIV